MPTKVKTKKYLECTCTRCGHVWNTEGLKKPLTCSRCRNRYWDQPRKPSKWAKQGPRTGQGEVMAEKSCKS